MIHIINSNKNSTNKSNGVMIKPLKDHISLIWMYNKICLLKILTL